MAGSVSLVAVPPRLQPVMLRKTGKGRGVFFTEIQGDEVMVGGIEWIQWKGAYIVYIYIRTL